MIFILIDLFSKVVLVELQKWSLVCMGVTIQRLLPTLYHGMELQIAKTARTIDLWYLLQMMLHFVQIPKIQGSMLSPIWHIDYGRQYFVIKGCNSIFSILGFPISFLSFRKISFFQNQLLFQFSVDFLDLENYISSFSYFELTFQIYGSIVFRFLLSRFR